MKHIFRSWNEEENRYYYFVDGYYFIDINYEGLEELFYNCYSDERNKYFNWNNAELIKKREEVCLY